MPRTIAPSVSALLGTAAIATAAVLLPATPARAADLMRTMEGQPDLRIFQQARRSGADRGISSHQNIMVLAPIDDGTDSRLQQLLDANPAAARRFVLNHVVATVFPFRQSLDGSLEMFKTFGGAPVEAASGGSQPGWASAAFASAGLPSCMVSFLCPGHNSVPSLTQPFFDN